MNQVQQLTREKEQLTTRLVREKNQVVSEKDQLVRENHQLQQSLLQVSLLKMEYFKGATLQCNKSDYTVATKSLWSRVHYQRVNFLFGNEKFSLRFNFRSAVGDRK